MAVKASWSAGDVLTAADLTDTFAAKLKGVVASTAPSSPSAGDYWVDSSGKQSKFYTGSAWVPVGGKILQVSSTNKTNAFSTTSTSLVDVTGLSVSITPSSTTSTVLVVASVSLGNSDPDQNTLLSLIRGTTAVAQSTAGSTTNSTALFRGTTTQIIPAVVVLLDNPATASAVTYKIQAAVTGGTGYVNRRGQDSNFGTFSSITVLEVSA